MQVLLVPYPAVGHIHAFLEASSRLPQDCRVSFAISTYYRDYLKRNVVGEVYLLDGVAFGAGAERMLVDLEQQPYPYLDEMISRLTNRLYIDRQQHWLPLLEHLNCGDLVLLDSYLATDLIIIYQFLKRKKIKLALVQTMFPARKVLNTSFNIYSRPASHPPFLI